MIMETGKSKLFVTMTDQQRREHIAADERKRHAARTNELLEASPRASVEASVPHILHGIQAGPETPAHTRQNDEG
jgi:hypothetical protein